MRLHYIIGHIILFCFAADFFSMAWKRTMNFKLFQLYVYFARSHLEILFSKYIKEWTFFNGWNTVTQKICERRTQRTQQNQIRYRSNECVFVFVCAFYNTHNNKLGREKNKELCFDLRPGSLQFKYFSAIYDKE